ncbi:MAG: CBS domain-containing protein [bacterium]|jgi:acetoin utilization protein AcuB
MTYCSQLLDTTLQTADLHDTVSVVLALCKENNYQHLPVLDGNLYAGLVSVDDLEEAEDTNAELSTLSSYFIKPLVRSSDHFLHALKVRAKFFVNIVPVVNEENEWEGAITDEKLLDNLSKLTGVSDSGSIVVLSMPIHDYAPGEINRLVESNDAMIMHMNSFQDHHTGQIQVVLRINKEEVSDLVATFQRYEYNVLYYYGDETYDNSLQQNLDHLFNYLNI